MKHEATARIPRPEPTPGPRLRFAVYTRPPAQKDEVHHVVVGVDGNRAFAYEHGARRALIIASSSVFDTREDAERYLAGTGPFKWCVAHVYGDNASDEESGFIMFEARVTERRNRRCRWSGSFEKLFVAKNSELDEKLKRHSSIEVFDTKRQASAYIRKKVLSELKSATEETTAWTRRKWALARQARAL